LPAAPGRARASRRRLRLHGASHDRDRVRHRGFGGVDDRDAAAEAVDMDAVGDLEDVGHVVADQDDRQAAVLEVEDQLERLAGRSAPDRA
jgi:hypothetical protein